MLNDIARQRKLLEAKFSELVNAEALPFSGLVPSKVPTSAGVYLISKREKRGEKAYYVGESVNLRERLYRNHLMGQPASNARLKKYLIEAGECADPSVAKRFLQSTCLVRWVLEKR